ncbi:MAG TPA: pilus assembly protein [Ilumatobacteraceae bacterium]|nr:pilus assembly protein [Ilumatobacteraceae bacterium]
MRRHDRGQATVELALCLPFVCLLLCAVVQVAVIARDRVAVQLAAREGARAASVSAQPVEAAHRAIARATSLQPLDVTVRQADGLVTVRVTYTDDTSVPLIGALLSDAQVSAEVTMAIEQP